MSVKRYLGCDPRHIDIPISSIYQYTDVSAPSICRKVGLRARPVPICGLTDSWTAPKGFSFVEFESEGVRCDLIGICAVSDSYYRLGRDGDHSNTLNGLVSRFSPSFSIHRTSLPLSPINRSWDIVRRLYLATGWHSAYHGGLMRSIPPSDVKVQLAKKPRRQSASSSNSNSSPPLDRLRPR